MAEETNELNTDTINLLRGLRFDGCEQYINCGEKIDKEVKDDADKIYVYNIDNPHESISLNLQDLSNVTMCDDSLTNIGAISGISTTHEHDILSSTYSVDSPKKEMENELKEMELLIANKNFSFETDMIQYYINSDEMAKVCMQIHKMKWMVTTGMSKDDYENTLCVKYDLPEPDKDLMISVGVR